MQMAVHPFMHYLKASFIEVEDHMTYLPSRRVFRGETFDGI